MNRNKLFKVGKDFSLSIVASAVVTCALQILVYPFLASKYSANEYGVLLTVMGIVNILITALGNTLNNTRLIQEEFYKKREVVGDYNFLLTLASILGGMIVFVVGGKTTNMTMLNRIFLTVAAILGILRSYYSVQYRIILDFTKNMILNCVVAVGYILGILCFNLYKGWPIVFLTGEIIGLLYIIKTCSIVYEKFKFTDIFVQTSTKYIMLIITGVLANVLVYLDRLLLLPALGGQAVSVYTVASFFGKTLGIVMTPIAGVLLGYYAQKNFAMNRKLFWMINVIVIVISAVFFAFTLIFGKWFTGILYPDLIDQASKYMVFANLAAIISAAASMTQPSVLKYAPTYWQIIVQITFCLVYVGAGVFMLHKWGIMGFCIAAVMANFLRLFLLYLLGNIYIKS